MSSIENSAANLMISYMGVCLSSMSTSNPFSNQDMVYPSQGSLDFSNFPLLRAHFGGTALLDCSSLGVSEWFWGAYCHIGLEECCWRGSSWAVKADLTCSGKPAYPSEVIREFRIESFCSARRRWGLAANGRK